MTRFIQLLSMIQPDPVLLDLIRKAELSAENSSQVRMLALTLKARINSREQLVRMMYGKIANQHSPYTLGGARTFLALWTHQQKYALAIAGMIWLLHRPITPVQARAETVRRKLLFQRTAQSSSNRDRNSYVNTAMPQFCP